MVCSVQTLHWIIKAFKFLLISNSPSSFCWVKDHLYILFCDVPFLIFQLLYKRYPLCSKPHNDSVAKNPVAFTLHVFIYKYKIWKVRTSLSHIYIMWRKYRRWIGNYSFTPESREEVQLLSIYYMLGTYLTWSFKKILCVGYFYPCFQVRKQIEGGYVKNMRLQCQLKAGPGLKPRSLMPRGSWSLYPAMLL